MMFGRTVNFKTETGTISTFVLCTPETSRFEIIRRAIYAVMMELEKTAEVVGMEK